MEYLSTERILIVDLDAGRVEEEELEDSLVEDRIGGIGITTSLYNRFEDDDPIVIGTGLLTGTTYPASAGGQITAKSPASGKLCHCPIIFKVGIEIKYSGFDYIVIKGKAASPVYLWVHDGVADIEDAGGLWGKDVWQTTGDLRRKVGDDLLQTMMIGPAGEAGSDFAQVCYNQWNSPDRFGFGKLFGARNLKGLAFRGMGMIEVADPEEYVEQSLDILKEIKENGYVKEKGVAKMLEALGMEDVGQWLAPVVHRHSADYFTPYATNTALFLDEDPGLLEESKQDEPGVLISDIYALAEFKKLGLSAKDAGYAMKACAKYGIDPYAVARFSGANSLADIEGSLASVNGEMEMPGSGSFSPWCPVGPIFSDFGLDCEQMGQWWERRQAVAMIFGIQPMFSLMCEQITEENLLEMASLGTELDLTQEILDTVIDDILG